MSELATFRSGLNADASQLLALKSYLEENVKPHVVQWDDEGFFPKEVFSYLSKSGWMDLGWLIERSPAYKMSELANTASALSYYSPGIFTGWLAHLFAQTLVSKYAAESLYQKARTKEVTLMSLCGTEISSGTDIIQIETRAVREGDSYILSGKKDFISNAPHASHFIVLAQTSDIGDPKGLCFFWVPRQNGVMTGSSLKKLGLGESCTASVVFENVRVSTEDMVGRAGDGLPMLLACISRTRTLIAAASYGISRRAEEEALSYLAQAYRGGKPLLSKKEVQCLLAQLRTKMEAAWLLALKAGETWDQTQKAVCEASMAKLFATNVAVEVVNEALELVGAKAYLRDSILAKLYKDTKALEIYEGSTFIQTALISIELYSQRLKRDQLKAA